MKGTTTFQQAMDAGLTKEQIEEIIGGPMPAANTAIRDYCSQNGLSFSEIKTKLNDALAGGSRRSGSIPEILRNKNRSRTLQGRYRGIG